jgi:predicted rRNA methylase YqxC with S4 and FtsJ domains
MTASLYALYVHLHISEMRLQVQGGSINENKKCSKLQKLLINHGIVETGKGVIVKDEEKRLAVIERDKEEFETLGLNVIGVIPPPITGQKGNVEYLIYCVRG